MKAIKTIMKLVLVLAAVAGAVYVAITYGDKIVAWCKRMLASCPCCNSKCECTCGEEDIVEEAPVEDAPVEETPAVENVPVADEADFEG